MKELIELLMANVDLPKQEVKIVTFENLVVIKVTGVAAPSFIKRYIIETGEGSETKISPFNPRMLRQHDLMPLMRRMYDKAIPSNDMGLLLDKEAIAINKTIRCGFTIPNKKVA